MSNYNTENPNFTSFVKHPHCCPNPPVRTNRSAPVSLPKNPNCYDCGAFNIQGISGEKCCPVPANFPSPLDTSCCQYQYKKPGLIVCYKKTKYNTPYHVSGAQGPAKFRLFSQNKNYTGINKVLKTTRIQRGRWYHGLGNRKLHPLISEERDANGRVISSTCSKNLFANTDYQMPKRELMAYLARNSKYLHR